MKLTFLEKLYARPAPVACAYLDTSRDIDDPDKAIGLRRRHLQDTLAAQGTDAATLAAVAGSVGTDRDLPGRHGQAIFASHGQLLLAEELPEPPTGEVATFTELPDAMPLAVQHAPDIPYVAVVAKHADQRGEPRAVPKELEVEFQPGRWALIQVVPATDAGGRASPLSSSSAMSPYG
ncbi:hypothetical protein SAZ11_36630 [Streptomyces sp. FXJ1.4098]|uniref:hypothetical protein n=1 Tax=Streptomyces sp. NPDC020845 TaxID=3365096 RepID=UPI002991AE3D|nr:hypothetical protein [Streptomyces sp. FXJ1.4098]